MSDTDLDTSPVISTQFNLNVAAQLVEQMLAKAHPLLAEAIYFSAVPMQFDVDLMTAMRSRDDGRDERIVQRLLKISFINPVIQTNPNAPPRYMVQAVERQILTRRIIAEDKRAFLNAHRRALAFYEANPDPDPDAQVSNLLYHLLIVDGPKGIDFLSDTFRSYINDRRMAAAESILAIAQESRGILELMEAPWRNTLDIWVEYLSARMAQYQSRWDYSLQTLRKLMKRPDLDAELNAFIHRAYGMALANTGKYVEAIAHYKRTLEIFAKLSESQAEQGFTMIALGDAYVSLAVSARGTRDVIEPGSSRQIRWVRMFFSMLTLLPLLLYLFPSFGMSIWRPTTIFNLAQQDWIIARLFGSSARWYRMAHRKLEILGKNNPDRMQAQEKLANLYLSMGNVVAGIEILNHLLGEHTDYLGEYRQARIRASLARAQLHSGKFDEARALLNQAIPVIKAYEDVELKAQARGLMAEAELEAGNLDESIEQYLRAIRAYQTLGDTVGATEIVQRLVALQDSEELNEKQRDMATSTTQLIYRWQYTVRYQHPILGLFRRLSIIFLALFVFVAPVKTISISHVNSVSPGIGFTSSPPLLESAGFNKPLSLDLSPSLNTATPPNFEASVAGSLIINMSVIYIFVYLALGVILIVSTRSRSIQAAQSQALRMDLEGLSSGTDENRREIKWNDVTHVVVANRTVFGEIEASSSQIVVATPEEQITISGHTSWYRGVMNKVRELTPETARYTDLSFSLLGGKLGYIYGIGLLLIAVIIALFSYGPNLSIAPSILDQHIEPTAYSIADLYPYFYLMMFIPSIWWLGIWPVRAYVYCNPKHKVIWAVFALGVIIAGLREITAPIWFHAPDIYPELGVILVIGYTTWVAWKTRQPRQRDLLPKTGRAPRVYPVWVLILVTIVGGTLVARSTLKMFTDIRVYDLLVNADFLHTEAWDVQNTASHFDFEAGESDADVQTTIDFLQQSQQLYEEIILILPNHYEARNNLGTLQTELGEYEKAIENYSYMIDIEGVAPAAIYANRAVAYQSWSSELLTGEKLDTGESYTVNEQYTLAIEDYNRAIAMKPGAVQYYYWRGIALHTIGNELEAALEDYNFALEHADDPSISPDEVLVARGWLYFKMGDDWTQQQNLATDAGDEATAEAAAASAAESYQLALDDFIASAELNPESAETWLAIGFIYYRLDDNQKMFDAWDQAAQVDPENEVALLSRATGLWALAIDPFYCTVDGATEAERASSIEKLEEAIGNIDQALLLVPEDDFSYRTRAQMRYLLGSCKPEYDLTTQLKLAIEDYGWAIEYNGFEDFYWTFRARLEVALAVELFKQGDESEAFAVLGQAEADITEALELAPIDINQIWYDFITQSGEGYLYLKRANANYYDEDNPQAAMEDYRSAVDLIPAESGDATQALLGAARMSLLLGDTETAAQWYNEAISRATDHSHKAQLEAEVDELDKLKTSDPNLERLVNPVITELVNAVNRMP